MKITNRQLDALGSSDTAKKFYEAQFPVAIAWRIKLQREKLIGAVKALGEVREELAKRYCEKGVDGAPLADAGRYTFKGLDATRFAAEFEELLSQEVDVDTEPVNIPEAAFDAAGGWSANDLEALAPFVELVPTTEDSDSRKERDEKHGRVPEQRVPKKTGRDG